MGKTTKIDWCDATCNCFWGCLNNCAYCAARKFAKRFGKRLAINRGYSIEAAEKMADFKPVFLPDQLKILDELKKPSKIFMSFMGDPFDDYFELPLKVAFGEIRNHPEHTIMMLTKKPQNLLKHSPFPKNVWVGVSCTNSKQFIEAHKYLSEIIENLTFISFEPLLERIVPFDEWLLPVYLHECADWIIIGLSTPYSQKTAPKIEYVKEIVEAADKVKIPVFLKNNLNEVFRENAEKQIAGGIIPTEMIPTWASNKGRDRVYLRQEFPEFRAI